MQHLVVNFFHPLVLISTKLDFLKGSATLKIMDNITAYKISLTDFRRNINAFETFSSLCILCFPLAENMKFKGQNDSCQLVVYDILPIDFHFKTLQ